MVRSDSSSVRPLERASWLTTLPPDVSLVQLHLDGRLPGLDRRLALSSGTRLAMRSDAHDRSYEPRSRVPRAPWRLPSVAEEIRLISMDPPRHYGRAVALTRLLRPVEAAERDRIRGGEETVLKRAVLEPLKAACKLDEQASLLGWTCNSPDLKTTTVDRSIDQFIGLHVDSWEDLDLERRDASSNRISVNIGAGDRYFLYVPITIMDMARILAGEIGASRIPLRDLTLLGRMFLQRRPEVPVVRCRLAPGEAYLAPTENLVHDGSSEGQRHPDEHVTILHCFASLKETI